MKTEDDTNPVQVFAGTPLNAGMIQSLLTEAGIPAFIENELMSNIAPWQVTPGGSDAAKVVVALADEEKALQIISEYNPQ